MSDFFESEIVREELQEINELQEEIYGKMMNLSQLSTSEDRKEHVEKLTTLLEKQRLMYTRLSLSDDPVWESVSLKIKKYIPFININVFQYKTILRELVHE